MRQVSVLTAALVGICVTAGADDIVVGGQPYKNVLVTRTSAFYYVQIPDEGRTVSVPIGEVDASTVKINDDPFYRDAMKERYSENRTRRAAGELDDKEVDPEFRTGAGGAAGSASLEELRGAAGGAMGARSDVEALLSQFGMRFQPGPGRAGQPSVIARMPDGSTIELVGPPQELKAMVIKATVPAQQLSMATGQMRMLMSQMAPAAASQINGLFNEVAEKGSSQFTMNGVTMSAKQQANGPNVNFELEFRAGG